jgi:hypothetical protein
VSVHNPQAGTKFGWSLVVGVVVCVVLFLTFVGFTRYKYQWRSELLGRQLISQFHTEFNSISTDGKSGSAYVAYPHLSALRSELGKFDKLESCEITGYIEPSRLLARCVSWFEQGKAEESFMFRNYQGDNRLLSYSAKLLETESTGKGISTK